MVAQRNRRRLATNTRGTSGSTVEKAAGGEVVQARSTEGRSTVNVDRMKSCKTTARDQAVNGVQQSPRETITKQSAGCKDEIKTAHAAGTGSSNGQAGKQLPKSGKSSGSSNLKGAGSSGSRFSVLRDHVDPQESGEPQIEQQEQEGTAEMDTQEYGSEAIKEARRVSIQEDAVGHKDEITLNVSHASLTQSLRPLSHKSASERIRVQGLQGKVKKYGPLKDVTNKLVS